MRKLTIFDVVGLILVIVGGVNWGFVGFFGFDLVETLFGDMSSLSRFIYALVGLSAVYLAFIGPKLCKK